MSDNLMGIFAGLSDADKGKVSYILEQFGVDGSAPLDLLEFKIRLEGQKFHGTVTSDFARELWRLQQTYFRMVAVAIHGSPDVALTPEEKKKHQLVFRIENGSTKSVADLGDSLFDLLSKMVDKMEPWQIITVLVIFAGAYLGRQWMKSDVEKKKIAADKEKYASDKALIVDAIEANKEIFKAAMDAGRDSRVGLIKGIDDIDRAEIGAYVYERDDIDRIKRRATREKAQSETKILNVTVEDISTKDKTKPSVLLRERGTDNLIRASVSLNSDEEVDNDSALDIIWAAARYPDRYFWVEVSVVSRRGKVVEASILNAAMDKEDLVDDEAE